MSAEQQERRPYINDLANRFFSGNRFGRSLDADQ
jgi:hypothetical protein